MIPLAYDVLVVGAGMAGLTAAAYLAKAGLKVLLCEKEKQTGGLVNSFEYKGFVFDGGIRAIENSGIVSPMLRQLGLQVEFLPSPVSVGIGQDVITVSSRESLGAYQELLNKHFPDNQQDIAGIIREIAKIMDYMDVLYGIDNPLFLDLKNNPKYVFKTILPWAFKYLLTAPKIAKLRKPVDEYLAGFSTNQALLDIIAQHFFQKTPTFFALSYFSLYLDYRYPRGGTGALPKALEQFILGNGGEIRRETEITSVDPGRNQATDARGNVYQYKKLVWAADLKTLYRIADLASLTDSKVLGGIEARKASAGGENRRRFRSHLVSDGRPGEPRLCADIQPALLLHAVHRRSFPGQPGRAAQGRSGEPRSIHRRQTADRGMAEAVPGLHHLRNILSRSQGCLTRAGGQDRAHHQLAVRLFADEAHRGDGLV